jgi:actin
MSWSRNISPLVIDIGSSLVKAGFAGDDAPRTMLPTIVGRPRVKPGTVVMTDDFVGKDAINKRGTHMQFPIPNNEELLPHDCCVICNQ